MDTIYKNSQNIGGESCKKVHTSKCYIGIKKFFISKQPKWGNLKELENQEQAKPKMIRKSENKDTVRLNKIKGRTIKGQWNEELTPWKKETLHLVVVLPMGEGKPD